MDRTLSYFLLICGCVFLILVIYLLMKNKVSERDSILWLVGSLVILMLSGNPNWIDGIAHYVGISYPPALLFLLSNLVLLLYCLHQSIQISKLSAMIKEVTQYMAVQKEALMELKRKEEQAKQHDGS